MKALVLHGPGAYRFEPRWPRPQSQPGWALVRVRYAGICGSDLARFGTTGSYHHPMILGHEFAGTVVQPAPGSTRFCGGEAVAVLPIIPCGCCAGCTAGEPFHCSSYSFLGSRIDGGFAEYCAVPETNLFLLPAGLDLRAGAFIEPMAVALHALRRGGFRTGQSALVLGSGPIGLLIGLWLKALEARRVVMADVRPESLATAARVGLTERVQAAAVLTATGGVLFDAAFEAAGAAAALVSAVEALRDKGTLTVVGRDTRDTFIPRPVFERLMRKELTLCGCWGYNLAGEEELVFEHLGRGSFPVEGMISHQLPLEEAPGMIEAMLKGQTYYCKVLLEV